MQVRVWQLRRVGGSCSAAGAPAAGPGLPYRDHVWATVLKTQRRRGRIASVAAHVWARG